MSGLPTCLRSRIPGYNVVNAGVSGYGTDQEYLLLQRLWPAIEPKVVVLVFCTDNDRLDNSASVRYESYQKPYFATLPDGTLQLRGQPVPKSRQVYVKENWLVRHSLVARVIVYNYIDLVHPAVDVPDPTEKLVDQIRQFVEAHGAKLVVGLQVSDGKLMEHLQAERHSLRGFRRRRGLFRPIRRALDAERAEAGRRPDVRTAVAEGLLGGAARRRAGQGGAA